MSPKRTKRKFRTNPDFCVGSTVRLKGRKRTAKITNLFVDIEGGVRLDRHLGGFRCRNVQDLELVKGPK